MNPLIDPAEPQEHYRKLPLPVCALMRYGLQFHPTFQMKLPNWASLNHPIAHRELTLWQKAGRRWRWLWIPFLTFPLCCAAACGLTLVPQAIADSSLAAWLFTIVLPLLIALWGLHGFATWGLSLFTTVGAATFIARERETQNWALLRITTLGVREIIGAKIAALLYWLRWPILAVLALRLIAIAASVIGLAGIFYLIPALDPSVAIPPELQLGLTLGVGGAGIFGAALFALELFIGLFYNCAIGLTASSFLRTSASAVGIAFVAHLILTLFVFAPVQQIIGLGASLIGVAFIPANSPDVSFLPLILPILSGLLTYLANFALEIGVIVIGLIVSFEQVKRLAE